MSSGRPARAALLFAALLVGAAAVAVALDRTGDPSVAPAPVASPSPSPATTPRPSPSPPETLAEQIERVARRVAELRGLDFDEVPAVTYLSPEELAARVATFLDEYDEEDADLDLRLLVALGAVAPGTDLRGLLQSALEEQVAGFYDSETGELVVGARDPDARLGPLEEVVLAHELEHALADAVLGLPEMDTDTLGLDALAARMALIEGDATATMAEYAQVAFSLVEQLRLAGEVLEMSARLGEGTDLPHVIERSLLFPYEDGMAFVEALRAVGGWPAVDRAYAEPPTTTAQILFPERYLRGEGAVEVAATNALGGAWQLRRTEDVGAADLLFLFEAPGDEPGHALDEPAGLVADWAGGSYQLWTHDGRTAVGVALATQGMGRLCGAVVDWYVLAFGAARSVPLEEGEALAVRGEAQDAAVRCSEDGVRLGIAPDLATARALVS